MRHWQQDGDLASLRDPSALAKLPADRFDDAYEAADALGSTLEGWRARGTQR